MSSFERKGIWQLRGISQSRGTTKLLFIRREKPRRLAASAPASGSRELSRRRGLHKIIYGMGLSRVKLFREIIGGILNSELWLFYSVGVGPVQPFRQLVRLFCWWNQAASGPWRKGVGTGPLVYLEGLTDDLDEFLSLYPLYCRGFTQSRHWFSVALVTSHVYFFCCTVYS